MGFFDRLRRGARRNPSTRGILLITPESLEALFVRHGWKMRDLAAVLRAELVQTIAVVELCGGAVVTPGRSGSRRARLRWTRLDGGP